MDQSAGLSLSFPSSPSVPSLQLPQSPLPPLTTTTSRSYPQLFSTPNTRTRLPRLVLSRFGFGFFGTPRTTHSLYFYSIRNNNFFPFTARRHLLVLLLLCSRLYTHPRTLPHPNSPTSLRIRNSSNLFLSHILSITQTLHYAILELF